MTTTREVRPTVSIADPDVGEREMRSVRDVLASGQLSAGETVRSFETEFAAYCGTDRAVATTNGTTALHTALEALDIGAGDAVITTPLSFVASANAIRLAGAEPVFADVDATTYNLDPDAVEAAIRGRDGDVDAIVAVHLYGLPAAMDRIREVADAYDLAVIEDAAQAHGAEFDGDRVGSLGDAACFSFYPTKNMTTGEGGMVVTDREDVARRARRFVNHGRTPEDRGGYDHLEVGHNFRLTSIGGAIGEVQLEKLPEYTRVRREYAAELTEALADVPGLEVPTTPSDRRHVFHQYTVRCDDREALRSRLEASGVGTGVYYPVPIHQQPAYDRVSRAFPEAERAAREVLSLPVHPSLSPEDVERVADAVHDAVPVPGGTADD